MPVELKRSQIADTAYLRLHGRDARAYTTGKTVAARFNYRLQRRRDRGSRGAEQANWRETAKEVHVVFNNNALDYAPTRPSR